MDKVIRGPYGGDRQLLDAHMHAFFDSLSLQSSTITDELRRDPLVQRWVIISDKRGKRPSDFKKEDVSDEPNSTGPCAFCPGFEKGTGHETLAFRDGNEDDAPDWRVRIIVNKFPAVSNDGKCGPPTGEGIVFGACHLPGFGSHEVVIETPVHDMTIAELPVSHVAEVLRAYQIRLKAFRKDPRFKYCQIFKNRGNRAGASMTHSHSQIMALPVITHNTEDEMRGAEEYYNEHKRCLFCDLVYHECNTNLVRLIDHNEHFVTVAPYAPRFPYETWLIPKRHASNYESISEEELPAMAEILKLTLKKFDVAFKHPPYNYMLQTAPLDQEHSDNVYYHWYLRIVPHLITVGGFELGSGCYINPVSPEKAADFLRNVEV